jgi:hypothetical protein
MNNKIEEPVAVSGWTPEEEARIAEIISGFSAAEISRIKTYSTLRMEAIRRMRCEQRKKAAMPVVKVKPIISKVEHTELRRDRRFGRPRRYETNADRQREYRRRLLQDALRMPRS